MDWLPPSTAEASQAAHSPFNPATQPRAVYRRYGFGEVLVVEPAHASQPAPTSRPQPASGSPATPERPLHLSGQRSIPHAPITVVDKRITEVQDADRRGIMTPAVWGEQVTVEHMDSEISLKRKREDLGVTDLIESAQHNNVQPDHRHGAKADTEEGVLCETTSAERAVALDLPPATKLRLSTNHSIQRIPAIAAPPPELYIPHQPPIVNPDPFAAVSAAALAERLMVVAQANSADGVGIKIEFGAPLDIGENNGNERQALLTMQANADVPEQNADMIADYNLDDTELNELLQQLEQGDAGEVREVPIASGPAEPVIEANMQSAIAPRPVPLPNEGGAQRGPGPVDARLLDDLRVDRFVIDEEAALKAAPEDDVAMEEAPPQAPALAVAWYEDGPECGICFEEADELIESALEAGKGGPDGSLVMYSCGLPNCGSVHTCNIQINEHPHGTPVGCPTCTRPIDLERLEAQAKAYDPTVINPIRRPPPPPPPPHIIFRPWIERYRMSRVDKALDAYEIADCIVYTMTHACDIRPAVANYVPTPLGDFQIACCVKVWGECFGLDQRTVLDFIKDACGVDLVLPRIEGGAGQGALQHATAREAFPAAPIFPEPAAVHAVAITEEQAAVFHQRIGLGPLQPVMDVLERVQLVFDINGLADWARACTQLATHLAIGKDHFIKLFASCEIILLQFILDLLHDPRFAIVRQGISVSPLILLVVGQIANILRGLQQNGAVAGTQMVGRADWTNMRSEYGRYPDAPRNRALSRAVIDLNELTESRERALAAVISAGGVLTEAPGGGRMVWMTREAPARAQPPPIAQQAVPVARPLTPKREALAGVQRPQVAHGTVPAARPPPAAGEAPGLQRQQVALGAAPVAGQAPGICLPQAGPDRGRGPLPGVTYTPARLAELGVISAEAARAAAMVGMRPAQPPRHLEADAVQQAGPAVAVPQVLQPGQMGQPRRPVPAQQRRVSPPVGQARTASQGAQAGHAGQSGNAPYSYANPNAKVIARQQPGQGSVQATVAAVPPPRNDTDRAPQRQLDSRPGGPPPSAQLHIARQQYLIAQQQYLGMQQQARQMAEAHSAMAHAVRAQADSAAAAAAIAHAHAQAGAVQAPQALQAQQVRQPLVQADSPWLAATRNASNQPSDPPTGPRSGNFGQGIELPR